MACIPGSCEDCELGPELDTVFVYRSGLARYRPCSSLPTENKYKTSVSEYMKKKTYNFAHMSVKAWGGGIKALVDMSAKNVSF